MPLSPDAWISFSPRYEFDGIPFSDLLRAFIALRFDRDKCQAHLEQLLCNDEVDTKYFDLSGFGSGGLIATEALLFPEPGVWALGMGLKAEPGGIISLIDNDSVEAVADLIRLCLRANEVPAFLSELGSLPDERTVKRMFARQAPPPWPQISGPGILRREHASLVVSSEQTNLLIDPIAAQHGLPHISETPIDPGVERLDAILITHSHADHWHLPSILLHPKVVPVIVPRVERSTLLTRDVFENSITSIGQKAIAPPWGSTLTIGDIEIDVLPFYGEQPTRSSPGAPKNLRSWGNCYRINTPGFSALLLVDSGSDPEGDMVEVVKASVDRRGPVDVVLACLREFASPFFGGLEFFWVTLPFSRLQQLFEEYERGVLPSTTAGVQGLIELCRISGTRYFLPYADGFEGVGKPITDVGWGAGEPSEASRIRAMQDGFRKLKIDTVALDWRPADALLCQSDDLVLFSN